jgi:hypothetical protein
MSSHERVWVRSDLPWTERRPLRTRGGASTTGLERKIRRDTPHDAAAFRVAIRPRIAPAPTPRRRIWASHASTPQGSRSTRRTVPMSSTMRAARLRWSRSVVGCHSSAGPSATSAAARPLSLRGGTETDRASRPPTQRPRPSRPSSSPGTSWPPACRRRRRGRANAKSQLAATRSQTRDRPGDDELLDLRGALEDVVGLLNAFGGSGYGQTLGFLSV